MPNYIMTFTDGYTRLRRDPGFQLLSENRTVKALAGVEYQLSIVLKEDQIRCFINDIPVHAYRATASWSRPPTARSWPRR